MALSARGKTYLKFGTALVLIVGGIEVARRRQKGGPYVSRKSWVGRSLIKPDDVGWSELKSGGVSEDRLLQLATGDEILVVEVICYNPDCTKFDDTPIGVARYSVEAIGPEGIVLKKAGGFMSKGPHVVEFPGTSYSWTADLAPMVRGVSPGLASGTHCAFADPDVRAEKTAQGLTCDQASGNWVTDPAHLA